MKKKNPTFIFGILLGLVPVVGLLLLFAVGFLVSGKDPLNFLSPIFLSVVVGIAFVFGLIGSILMVISFIPEYGNQKILTEGIPAEAKVLEINSAGMKVMNMPVIEFTLEVRPANQPAFKAETTKSVPMIHLFSYQPGKIVNVKFLPDTKEVVIVGAKES